MSIVTKESNPELYNALFPKDEIKINKANKSITFINNGIAFSQFGVADEILDLITNLEEKYDKEKTSKKKAIEYIKNKQELNKMFGTITLNKDSQKELLNILGGDENAINSK